ncbi:MAG TPA: NADH-quinone oxidoreductase subunit NuoE [Deltaproteobacteria bacterium]|nr:NADH-quinone oxidoreductase subunit NuoE [Deltaproteobacteria bacterium]
MFSQEIVERIEAATRKYPNRKSATMEALRIAQSVKGHLEEDDMREVARLLGVSPVDVLQVAAFYTMYNVRRPVGRYHIQVCRNISCSLLGAEHLIGHMERKLDIKLGGTTADGKFTLTTVECLGSCGTAPVMQINEDYYENLTAEKIDEILAGLD